VRAISSTSIPVGEEPEETETLEKVMVEKGRQLKLPRELMRSETLRGDLSEQVVNGRTVRAIDNL
jgi:hypothetical protein